MECSICGGRGFSRNAVLWPELIEEWELSPEEADYINRQQGENCLSCGANLRSVVLASALSAALETTGPLREAIGSVKSTILEINEAGTLHGFLSTAPNATYAAYPEVDMQNLPHASESFDVVVHSDTLEHIENPIKALAECCRVLKRGGALCYTVPTIVGRLSRRRDTLARSYHGAPGDGRDDHLVISEYGADMWTEPLRAGFKTVEIFSLSYPAGLAMLARK